MIQSVRDCAEEVFRELGSGHSEAVYEAALVTEMELRDLVGPIMRQVPCPIQYKGYVVGVGYIDIMVDNTLIVELKAVNKLTSRDQTQVRKYLAGTNVDHGLLVNFNQGSETLEVIEIGAG